MKKLIFKLFIAVMVIAFSEKINAQTQSSKITGLYLTSRDYLDHKLSYADNKIQVHNFWNSKYVTVTADGKKTMILKSNIFGYQDKDKKIYRFYQNEAFEIVDTTNFYLYTYEKLVPQGKGSKPTKAYYFSTDAGSKVLLLTEQNIAKGFVKNPKFKYMVEAEFKSDADLNSYDSQLKEYEIKELYLQSIK
jgi:hypothetical protein